MKRTKIVSTIGPSSDSREKFTDLINSGVNIFRFNTKHNQPEWHKEKILLVREIAKELNIQIGILVDLQGPDIRTGSVKDGKLFVKPGDEICFEVKSSSDNSIELKKSILDQVKVGQEIIIDDGEQNLVEVIEKTEDKATLKVIKGTYIKDNRTLFFPGHKIDIPSLTDRDRIFLDMAVDVNAEFVAVSFVREDSDVTNVRDICNAKNYYPHIISKMETADCLVNMDSILDVSDVLMVARGDLAVEAGFDAVPKAQLDMIKRCREQGKPVIVATQMMESMIDNAHPTRAEVNDVATAVFSLTDAIMTSGETAAGKYPVETINYMSKVAVNNELENVVNTKNNDKLSVNNISANIVKTAYDLDKLLEGSDDSKCFVVFANTGTTARYLSSLRPETPIYTYGEDIKVNGQLCLNWGVTPFSLTLKDNLRSNLEEIKKDLISKKIVSKGDKFIFISSNLQESGMSGVSMPTTVEVVTV